MKSKKILLSIFMLLVVISLTACEENINNPVDKDKTEQIKEVTSRKDEYISQLDNIQIELDKMPEKADSDKGVTNAMKNYYGLSYEAYDKELNEIYNKLKEDLPKDTMADLKEKQLQWIKDKEKKADEAKAEFEGGTFENVAMYVSLYESTKERCYFLVNNYILD